MLLLGVVSYASPPVDAAAGTNKQINFQGKLVNTNGTNVANGTYNIQFNIVQGGDGCNPTSGSFPCSGSVVWTENRIYGTGAPDNRVTVTDGMFQVNLGSVTSLPGSVNFNDDTLWLSINLGDTSTAASFAAASGDGEMKPLVRFTSAVYSFNSDLLDGLDSAAFGQLASAQTWASTQTIQPTTNVSSLIVRQTSAGSPNADILRVTTANGTNDAILVAGPAANEAVITLTSFGAGNDITLNSVDQIILNAGSSSSIVLSDYITDANGVLFASTTGVLTRVAETETGSQCLLSGAGSSGVPTWGSCGGGSDLDGTYDSDSDKELAIDSTSGLIFDMTTTGDFVIQDSNNTIASFDDSGGITFTPNGTSDLVAVLDSDSLFIARTGGNDVATLDSGGSLELVQNGRALTTVTESAIKIDSTIVKDGIESFYGYFFTPTIDVNADPTGFGGDFVFRDSTTRRVNASSGTLTDSGGHLSFSSSPNLQGTGNNNSTLAKLLAIHSGFNLTKSGTGTFTVTEISSLESSGVANANTIVTTRSGVNVLDATGSGTVTAQYGLKVANLTKGSSDYGVYIEGADTAAIWVDSGATLLDGTLTVGGVTQINNTLDVTGQITAGASGVEFAESDTNPSCAAGNYNIFADASETKLKKCVNGVVSDIGAGDKFETYTSSGTYTKPSDAIMIILEAWGGGGGGGGGAGGSNAAARTGGGGGGGGAFTTSSLVAADIGGSAEVTVGAGGNAGSAGSGAVGGNGGAGGDSCFSTSSSCGGSMLLRAWGGGGGGGAGAAGNGGGGGGGALQAGGSSGSANGGAGGDPNGSGSGSQTENDGAGGSAGRTAGTGANSAVTAHWGGAGGGASTTTGAANSGSGGSSRRGGSGGGAGGSCAITTCTARDGGEGGTMFSSTPGGGGTAGTGGGAGGAGDNGTGNGGEGGGGGANNSGGAGGAGGLV